MFSLCGCVCVGGGCVSECGGVGYFFLVFLGFWCIYVCFVFTIAKVLLHPQGQHPLVKELGFSVSPGFETSVSVRYNTVSRFFVQIS